MGDERMHEVEVEVDVDLVRTLLCAHHPTWADRPIDAVATQGTDNAPYRIGPDLLARLPRNEGAAARLAVEQAVLPRLAPRLPLTVPELVARGEPDTEYPYAWSVLRWLEGSDLLDATGVDEVALAHELAGAVAAFGQIDDEDGPRGHRCGPVSDADPAMRAAIAQLPPDIDQAAVTAAWDEVVAQPEWTGPLRWTHGDLHPTNLLVREGRLVALLDLGCAGLGDPAADLMPAWTVLRVEGRAAFRRDVDADDDTWARGRGWALRLGVMALPYYERTNPRFAGVARRTIEQVLEDYGA